MAAHLLRWPPALALALAAALAAPGSSAARGMTVSAPLYESPGGTVPVIVTAHAVPPGYRASIAARATGGAVVRCAGPAWINRIRRLAARKCYLRLPLRRGSYRVVATARLTRAGAAPLIRSGTGARPIRASGQVSSRPMSAAAIESIERCHNSTDRVWLTFDDGGSPQQVRRILVTLAANRVRGRFFFTGAWARRNAVLLGRIRREGHLVANHSSTHVALSEVPAARVGREIDDGVRADTAPKLLRPPFAAGALTTRLQSLAAARGYRLCRWTVDTYDWHGVGARRMAERVRHGDELTPPVAAGGNILMHGTAPHTASGLQLIIDAVRAKGLLLEAGAAEA